MNSRLLKLSALLLAGSLMACGQPIKDVEDVPNSGASITTSNLQAVEAEYLPEAISDDGSAIASQAVTIKSNPDICAGLDFIQCQPRLIRAYLLYGKAAVYITHKVVLAVARELARSPDNSSGIVRVEEENLVVEYIKRSLLDFDFLVIKDGVPVGRVSANPALYNIQFDLNVLEKDKPDSRGGKIDVKVQFANRTQWSSEITITGAECNVLKPEEPENARLKVTRTGEIWSAQAMFYNGIAAKFDGVKSCSDAASDNTGLVLYSDVVANRRAAKAAIYAMKRTETSTTNLENFGLPGVCSNYSDICQGLATSLGISTTDVNNLLGQMSNPYCIERGSRSVTFNSDCRDVSTSVANAPFLPNGSWMSPYDFYRLDVTIPEHL